MRIVYRDSLWSSEFVSLYQYAVVSQLLVKELFNCSDDEDAEARCKENLDLAVAADPSNAEAYHTLASYWLCKGDRQVCVFFCINFFVFE